MAPTRQENEMVYVDQRSTLSAESVLVPQPSTNNWHEKRSEICVRLTRRTYPCYGQQMIPDSGLESRQAASHPVAAITGIEALSPVEVTAVLPNPVSLHANIIPLATLLPPTTTNSSPLHLKEPSSVQIALIVAGALGVVVASFGMMILVTQFSWSFRGLKLYYRRSTLKEEHALGKGMTFIRTGCDTTCATTTCVVHTLDSDEVLNELKTTSNLARNSCPVQRSFNCALSTTLVANNLPGQPMSEADWNRDDSRERLQIEEKDIAITLVAALRDLPSWGVEPDATNQPLAPARNRAEDLSRTRSRQRSDASTPSQETTTTGFIECSSSASFSSRSSMTSSSSMVTSFDEEWSAYEVKRALTQSLEMRKGVLVAWPCANATILDIFSATLAPLSHISCEIRPSLATTDLLDISLAVEALEGHRAGLQRVPHLVVTCPSMSTIITLNSIDSSISIDLSDFPLPPSLIKPTVAQKRLMV